MSARGIGNHVVRVSGGAGAQVGVADQRPVSLTAQDLAVAHGHHEQPAVAQLAEAGRLVRDARFDAQIRSVLAG